MALYFAAILGIGLKFARSGRSVRQYFLGEGKTPTWVLGLSVIAAKISSLTFLALPAAAYVLDWRMFTLNVSVLPVALLAVWWVVPFFRRSEYLTAFEYLHQRFGPGARLYGAAISLLTQALRMGSVLYLVSLPVKMFTGMDTVPTMLCVGGFCTLYTVLGGIQAVVWSDVIQAIVLYLGGIAALTVMVCGIDGGLGEIFSVAMANDKFSMGPMEWDMGERTFWTVLITGATGWIGQYTSDQVLIQRYLMAKDVRQARMAGWMSAVLCLPTWGFFFFLGTALFVYYRVSPDAVAAGLPADEVFPYFILTRMPSGLVGLVLAGIISAAMGALSASLNAFATVATVDVVKPYVLRGRSDRFYAWTARALTGLGALIMLGLGLFFAQATKESFFDLFTQILGMVGGVLPAFFLLGFFDKRVDRRALWLAFAVVLACNVYLVGLTLKIFPNPLGLHIHPYWISTLMTIAMLALGFLFARTSRGHRG